MTTDKNENMTRSKDTEISNFQLDILLRIQQDPQTTRRELSRLLKKDPKTIKYHLNKLISAGLVQETDHRTYKSYSLTPDAEQYLKTDQLTTPVCRTHWIHLRFNIIKDYKGNLLEIGWDQGRDPDKWNWASFIHRLPSALGEIYIEKTPRSFLITLPKIITSHPSEADRIKDRLAFAVSKYLQKELPGLKLGILNKFGKVKVAHQKVKAHYGIPGDPLAAACTRLGMTLRSDRLLIDNSPGHESLLDNNGNILIGEVEAINRTWNQEDCHSLFDRYHEMIGGSLSAGRIDTVEDIATGTRQVTESLEKSREFQDNEIQSLKKTQKTHEIAIGKITSILDRIDSSMRIRDESFKDYSESLIRFQKQQEVIRESLTPLIQAVNALSERVMSPLTALKEQIVCFDDVNSGIAQRAIKELSDSEKRELKKHIAGLYW